VKSSPSAQRDDAALRGASSGLEAQAQPRTPGSPQAGVVAAGPSITSKQAAVRGIVKAREEARANARREAAIGVPVTAEPEARSPIADEALYQESVDLGPACDARGDTSRRSWVPSR